jgi:hypothetical protein
MRQKIIYVIISTPISIDLSLQAKQVGMTKQMVDSILNYAVKVDTLFKDAYASQPDMGVLFSKSMASEIINNYTISCWLTNITKVANCSLLSTKKNNPTENYKSLDLKEVNCD